MWGIYSERESVWADMSEYLFVGFARAFMCVRECVAPERTHELSEQAVCDINSCLDQLRKRSDILTHKSDECMREAAVHARKASYEATTRFLQPA